MIASVGCVEKINQMDRVSMVMQFFIRLWLVLG